MYIDALIILIPLFLDILHCEVSVRLCFRTEQSNPIRIIGELIRAKENFKILTIYMILLPVLLHWLGSILHIDLFRVDYNTQCHIIKPLFALFLAFANGAILSSLNVLIAKLVIPTDALVVLIVILTLVVLQSSYFSKSSPFIRRTQMAQSSPLQIGLTTNEAYL